MGWNGVHVSQLWRLAIQTGAWAIAAAWMLRAFEALRGMPSVPDLRMAEWERPQVGLPSLTVVVPAKDEAENIAASLDALLLADYRDRDGRPPIILAVDDRSTDATGAILDDYAARFPERIEAIHVRELPEGWLGKTFALAAATEHSASRGQSDYLLFTDADVLFSPSILRRALAYAETTEADHLVVLPTMQIKAWGEGTVLGFFQVLGLWASRPWRVSDAESRRDVIGVGAFNMVRRDALSELGGWAPQRLAVLEDVTLGRRMKAAGMRQRIAFAPGFVQVHWAAGARGLMRVMVKNMFSAFNFQPLLVLGAVGWIMMFCVAPLAGLLWWGTLAPALLVMACVATMYRVMGKASEIDARYAWLYPLGALAFIVVLLRSMVTVMWQRGVVWRGTHYSLKELRQHNSPFQWERQAAEAQRLAKGNRV
jgi:glycosyltransferase involved in cell wall biosynthesis